MLEIPIHIGYKHRIGKNISLFASTGIYFAYGLFGKQDGAIMEHESLLENPDDLDFQFDYGSGVEYVTSAGDTYKGYGSEKRFDWGIGIKIGTEFWDHFQVSENYNWGLNNLRNDSDFNSRNLMISCAYIF